MSTPSPALIAANLAVHKRIVARCNNDSPTIGEDGERSTPSPCEIGQDYAVKAASFSNEQGGTECVALAARVTCAARWWDYETGWRFTGIVTALTQDAISSFSKKSVAVPAHIRFGEFDLVPLRR